MLVKRALAIVLLLVVSAVPVIAAEGDPEPPTRFDISLIDYQFAVAGQESGQPLVLQAGRSYELHFNNNSSMKTTHEVLFGKNAITVEGGFKHDYETPMLDDVEVTLTAAMAGQEVVIGAAGLNEFELPYGGEITISFTLPDSKVGDWEIGCFEYMSPDSTEENPGPTHFDAGMHLPVHVESGM